MLEQEAIISTLNKIVADIISDAQKKGQKIPSNSFRVVATNDGAQLWGADYFKYLVLGRPPGKQPPPDKMLEFVQKNPQILAEAKQHFKYITEKGLAYLIGRKIGREGTDIYTGKKKGIDFIGSIERNMPELYSTLLRNESINILTNLTSTVK